MESAKSHEAGKMEEEESMIIGVDYHNICEVLRNIREAGK